MSNSTALYERLTPRQVVSYFGELNGLSSDEIHRRIRTIFQRLEITDFADSRCDKLSTGQKQRVSIARTIVHEPKVLVFDEPTNGLDILASRVIIRFIKDCKAEGRTIIFSTHILSEIEEICDQIGIVYNGKLVASGTQSELQIQTGQTNLRNVFLSVMGAE
jgi:sodium transport system ATP-binding protein